MNRSEVREILSAAVATEHTALKLPDGLPEHEAGLLGVMAAGLDRAKRADECARADERIAKNLDEEAAQRRAGAARFKAQAVAERAAVEALLALWEA